MAAEDSTADLRGDECPEPQLCHSDSAGPPGAGGSGAEAWVSVVSITTTRDLQVPQGEVQFTKAPWFSFTGEWKFPSHRK